MSQNCENDAQKQPRKDPNQKPFCFFSLFCLNWFHQKFDVIWDEQNEHDKVTNVPHNSQIRLKFEKINMPHLLLRKCIQLRWFLWTKWLNKRALGWVEFLQILLQHSVSSVLYFRSSKWCILLKSVAYRTVTKQLIFYLKNEIFEISQLLSKHSSGSWLIPFGLKLDGMSVFKIFPPRAPKRPIMAQFSQALWQFYLQPFSIICTFLTKEAKVFQCWMLKQSQKIQLTLARVVKTVEIRSYSTGSM